ncbi:hypothetical protein TrCOL_g4707 [Triparma columacea]|uniref:Uncharacterized protein n=1 Tax=Triparma columacea TaxID=722753 RepID=A0A9W7G0R6_9STRA|nr:hypothetical protein TrCOL_g4707 [Triparma columacea]
MKVAFGRTSHSTFSQRRPIDARKPLDDGDISGLLKDRPVEKVTKVPLAKGESPPEVSSLVNLCVSSASLRSRSAELREKRAEEKKKRKELWEGRGGINSANL